MAASDFAVAKSGGLTVSESLAMGLPMVVIRPIPGQEERNATYLLENGAALWAHSPAYAVYKTELLLRDEKRLRRMQRAAKKLAQPGAARKIVELVMRDA
jgi:processive 1,2-diacylglycerol beta-glucosyltransferase